MPADSLRPLSPRGIYLTEDGFRKVLIERNELLECREILVLRDKAIHVLKVDNGILEGQNKLLKTAVSTQSDALSSAKQKFRGAHVERWLWRTAAIIGIICYLR